MTAARKLYSFDREPARRIVDPTPAEVLAFNRRPGARNNRGRVAEGSFGAKTPLQIISSTTIIGWWRSDLGITIGTGVSAWADQSGNGRTLAQAVGANQPTYSASDASFNNKPSLTFNGVAQILANAGGFSWTAVSGSLKPWFRFIVKQLGFANGNNAICTVSGGATGYVIHQLNPSPDLRQFASIGANLSGGATIGSVARCVANFTNSTSDYLQTGSSGKVGGANSGTGAVGTDLYLGGNNAGSFVNWAVGELLITSVEPTAGEQSALDQSTSSFFGGAVLL